MTTRFKTARRNLGNAGDLLLIAQRALPFLAIIAAVGLAAHAYAKLSVVGLTLDSSLSDLRQGFLMKKEGLAIVTRWLSPAVTC